MSLKWLVYWFRSMCYNALFVYENEHGNSSAKGLLIYKYEVVLPVFFVVRRVLYAY